MIAVVVVVVDGRRRRRHRRCRRRRRRRVELRPLVDGGRRRCLSTFVLIFMMNEASFGAQKESWKE